MIELNDRKIYLSKAEEKKLFAKLLAKLPSRYVRDILTYCAPNIENAIDSDFGFIPLADFMAESERQRAELSKARADVDKKRAELKTLENAIFDRQRYLAELEDAYHATKRAARLLTALAGE
jgi:hypothetical protein